MWLEVVLISNQCSPVIDSGGVDLIPGSSRDSLCGLVQPFSLVQLFDPVSTQLQSKGSNLWEH